MATVFEPIRPVPPITTIFIPNLLDGCAAYFYELAQRLEPCAQLFHKKLRLFPCREVTAFVELVVVDEVRVGLLDPAPRRRVKLFREDADGHRDGDAPGLEEGAFVLPVETTRRNPVSSTSRA